MPVTRPALPPRYATPELIGHGGMGEVDRAVDASLGRTVAVKVLAERWTSDEEFHARFLREARTAASLSGEPNVIAIYDVSETGEGVPFIVMEYAIEGTLADRLRRGAIASEKALPWLEQTARALDSAHARGVVHRPGQRHIGVAVRLVEDPHVDDFACRGHHHLHQVIGRSNGDADRVRRLVEFGL